MKLFLVTLVALLVSVAVAFWRPAVPHQVENVKPNFAFRGGAESATSCSNNADYLLDNPEIEEDPNITPARKCGFCLGVRDNIVWNLMMLIANCTNVDLNLSIASTFLFVSLQWGGGTNCPVSGL